MIDGMVFLILMVCILAYTGQTFFSKLFSLHYNGSKTAATPVYAVIYCAVAGIVIWLFAAFRFAPSLATVLLGMLNGAILFLYLLSLLYSSRLGSFSFNSIALIGIVLSVLSILLLSL